MAPRGRGGRHSGDRSSTEDHVNDPSDHLEHHSDDDQVADELPLEPSQRVLLHGIAKAETFSDAASTRYAVSLLKGRWRHVWSTWKDVPTDERNILWAEFMRRYTCPPDEIHLVRWTFEHTLQRRMTGILSRQRKNAQRLCGSSDPALLARHNPPWMPSHVWERLMEVSATDAFKARSEAGRKNRLTEKAGGLTKHTGGSIPFTAHRERMASSSGAPPTQFDVFKKTHQKKGTEEFIDGRSQKFAEEYAAACAERRGESSSHPIDVDADAWMRAAGESRKGRVYGYTLGDSPGTASHASSCSRGSRGSCGTRGSRVSRVGLRICEVEEPTSDEILTRQDLLDAMERTVMEHVREMRAGLETTIQQTIQQNMQDIVRLLSQKGPTDPALSGPPPPTDPPDEGEPHI